MINHTPTSSSFAGNDSSESGSQWNDQLTRRRFLKRSGAASVATIIAWNLTSKPTLAEAAATGKSDEEKVWKSRRWGCKRVLAGPSNTPFSAETLASLDYNYNMNSEPPHPFSGDPTGPPSGGHANDPDGNDPEITEWWVEPASVNISRSRSPASPTLQNWTNPADGKIYAAYIYDYFEMKTDNATLPPP